MRCRPSCSLMRRWPRWSSGPLYYTRKRINMTDGSM
jgi:hypothetical protein